MCISKIKTIIIAFLLLLVGATNVIAADYFVLDGGSSSNCTSWSDACDQITTAEGKAARGDTIYVGDGEYTNLTFNTPTSGTTVITVKKATIADHGTNTGWDNAYGDGQAVLSGGAISFSTSYWVLDGQTRTTETSGHGFKIIGLAAVNQYGININGVDNITIRYTEITSPNTPIVNGCGANNTCTGRGIHMATGTDYLTFEYGYIHDVILPVMMAFDNSNFVFRYSVAARNDSTSATHSEAFSVSYGTKSDFNIYNNKFIDIEGTAVIAVMNQANITNFNIYNNISYYTTGATQTGTSNGWLTCTNSGTVCTNFYIYNNTMVNLPSGLSSKIDIGSGGTAYNWNVKNNLWYCNTGSCASANNDSSAEITYDNNWYGGVSYTAGENGLINGGTSNPFTNSAAYDFTLVEGSTPINAGTTLGIPYNKDYAGNDRDASYDMGAYEYGKGELPPVQPVQPVRYTLSVSSAHGTVSSEPTGINCGATCSALYDSGSEVTLTMGTVAAGYTFQGWQGDCTGTGITCTVTMNAAKTVTAQFAVNTYALTVSKAGTGSGTVTSAPVGISCGSDCAEDYVVDTQVTLTATPLDNNSTFAGWSGEGCTGIGTCTVTMNTAKSVTAKFDAEYTLTVSKPYAAAGTVSSSPAGINCGTSCTSASASYIQGTSVTLHPETAGEGYIFEGWTGGICTGKGDCTVAMDVSKSVTAQFSVKTSDLNVEKSGDGTGRVTGDNGRIDCGQTCGATYEYGDSFTLAAAASSGSDFAGWSGDCSGTAPCLVSMTAPRTVNAIFTLSPISQYVLTLINDGNGNGSVSSNPVGISNCSDTCQANYDSNVSVELTPAPLDNSTFAGWSGACTGKAACIVSMTAARSVTATFTLIPPPSNYTLTLVKDGDGPGTVSSSPAGINCGATCSADFAEDISVVLTASPVNGTSNFAGWTGDCAGTGATCSVPMTKARSVTARFTLIPPPSNYALTVLKDGSGSGNVVSTPTGVDCGATCSANFTSGASVQLTAKPITDHTFGGWSGDCTGTGVCQVTMNATKSVRATFVKPNALVLLIKKIGRGLGRIKSTNLYASSSSEFATTDIDCGDVCTKEYDIETTVTLSAEPEQGYSFAGWSGACSGTGACTVTVSEVTSVTANFVANEVDSGSPAPVGAGGGGGGGCFIATAAYGSYLDPHVMVLREFRDKVLLKNKYGRMFVAFYYKNSPAIADRISRIESLRLLTRLALTPMVYAMAYPMAAAMILLAGLLLIEIAVRRKKQVKSIPLAASDSYFQRGPRRGFVRVR